MLLLFLHPLLLHFLLHLRDLPHREDPGVVVVGAAGVVAPQLLLPLLVLALLKPCLALGAQVPLAPGKFGPVNPLHGGPDPEGEVGGWPWLPLVCVYGVLLQLAPFAPHTTLAPMAALALHSFQVPLAPPSIFSPFDLLFKLLHGYGAGAGSREHHLVGSGCTLAFTGQGDTSKLSWHGDQPKVYGNSRFLKTREHCLNNAFKQSPKLQPLYIQDAMERKNHMRVHLLNIEMGLCHLKMDMSHTHQCPKGSKFKQHKHTTIG